MKTYSQNGWKETKATGEKCFPLTNLHFVVTFNFQLPRVFKIELSSFTCHSLSFIISKFQTFQNETFSTKYLSDKVYSQIFTWFPSFTPEHGSIRIEKWETCVHKYLNSMMFGENSIISEYSQQLCRIIISLSWYETSPRKYDIP